jgi:ZIP family zinc transporter
MVQAFWWGLLAACSLVIGGLVSFWLPVRRRTLGLIMAFGAGVLVSAVAFELVEEAIETAGGIGALAVGLFAGSLAFYLGDEIIDRLGGADRKRSTRSHGPDEARTSGLAIVLGIVLDGIPESIVIGLTLLTGGKVGAAMVVAVFLSNLPEAIAATAGLSGSGWSRPRILGLWGAVAMVSAVSAAAGYGLFGDAAPGTVAFVLGFAGGAILTMLADTMMPEAFEHGGRLVGVITTFGFATAVAVDALSSVK